ncbi:MAG: DUF6398 domain-containing protein [Demequina sp.]
MPKKRRPNKHPVHRTPQQRRHLHAVPDRPAEPDSHATELLEGVRKALRSDSPIELLGTVSTMVEVTDPRGRDPLNRDAPQISRANLVESFVEVPFAETTALLTVMARLLPDTDPSRAAIAEELSARHHPMPLWIRDLANDRVDVQVMRMAETLGDGENCVIGVRFESGAAFTMIVFIDHNMGSVVKDAFFLPVAIDELMARVTAGEFEGPAPDRIGPWDRADARATVAAAIEQGRRTIGMPDQDDWPGTRPAVEWLLTHLPEGGVADGDHEWSDADVEELKAEFLASPEGRSVDTDDADFAVDMILRFGAGYNVGGPLRWSPIVVARFLLDWMPSKVVVPYANISMLPTVLADFVQFVHRREGVDGELTGEVLLAVGSSVRAFSEAMAEGHPIWGRADDGFDLSAMVLEPLTAAVGGRDALDALDATPLPDEPFVWDGIPQDIHERVTGHLELLDRVADEHLDVEHRTAMRRFLSRVAVADPAIFRRRSSAARGAAAVAWAVCRANDTAGTYGADLTVRELAGWFGTTGTVSQRAEPMLRAIDAPQDIHWGALPLGTPDLLVSSRRERIIEMRDRDLAD